MSENPSAEVSVYHQSDRVFRSRYTSVLQSDLASIRSVRKIPVGRNGFAEGGGGEVSGRLDVSFRTGGHEVARRTINERRPPCRHSVCG
jgi:hypothetical protein